MSDLLPETAMPMIASAFGCDGAIAVTVAGQARFESFAPRAIIISGQEAGERLFLVITGHARMLAYGLDGRMIVIDDFLAGDLFGEGTLFNAPLGGDEVTAVERVEAAILAAATMVALMGKHNAIAMAISRLLMARLGALTRRLVEGATLSATGRIHAELLRMARNGADLTIAPTPVNSQLALRVSSTRETVSRTVNALLKRGIMRRDEDNLVLVSPHRLEELIF